MSVNRSGRDARYDRTLWSDLTSLRFTDAHHGVSVLGPVGVGKTHLASALGHIAIRHRISVHFSRADKLFTRLRAARLDNTLDAEMRRLARVELLILDDVELRPLDAIQTSDFYQPIVERHRKASTIVTSNREPAEWLTMMSDPLLAQSAVDRLTSGAHTLIIEGPSYRQREHPHPRATADPNTNNHDAHYHLQMVPYSWQHGGPITLASDNCPTCDPSTQQCRIKHLPCSLLHTSAMVSDPTNTQRGPAVTARQSQRPKEK